jgi:membrane protease YdiL (CAAX protease family)
MGQLTTTNLVRGLLNWVLLTILFGVIASWIGVFRQLLRREPLLPRTPLVERRKPPWGVGTVLLVMVVYFVGGSYAMKGYALATRGERLKVREDAPIRIDQRDARPNAGAGRVEAGPGRPGDPRPHAPRAVPPGRPDEAESLPWGLSLTELMVLQGTISSVLIVLLPCLARLTSGARLGDLGVSLRGWRRQAALGIVAVLFLMPIVYSVQAACVHYLDIPDPEKRKHPVEKMLREDFSAGNAYLAFLTAVVLAPLFEELLFRGLLQSWLVKAFDRFAGWLRRSASRGLPTHPLSDAALPVGAMVVTELDKMTLDDAAASGDAADGFWEAADQPENSGWEERGPADSHGVGTVPAVPEGGPDEVPRVPDAPYRPRSSAWTGAAIILTSLVFAALHAPQWPAPVPLFLLAVGLGVVYQRTGSLIAPICMHAVFNGFSTLMLFYATLGGPVKEKPEVRPVLERVAPVQKGASEAAGTTRGKT